MTAPGKSRFARDGQERNQTSAHAITVRLLGVPVTIRGLVFGIVVAAAVGFTFAWLYGDRVVRVAERFVEWLAHDRGSQQQSNRGDRERSGRVPKGAIASRVPQTDRASAGSQSRVVYRAAKSKLLGRVLPLRRLPNPNSEIIVRIPPEANRIEATGRAAVHHEGVWPFLRPVLWREVVFEGKAGWVCDHFIESQ